VTGTWITDEEATDPFYWAEHTCRTVHFSKGVGLLLENSETTLLEVGPGQSLTGFAIQHPNNGKAMNGHVFPSLRNRNENLPDELFLLNTIGRLWLGGVEIDPSALYAGEQRSRVPLPTYPFERRKFWIEPRLDTDRIPSEFHDDKDLSRTEMQNWFHIPGWKQSVLSQAEWNRNLTWMIFIDGSGLGRSLLDLLRRKNQEVVIVKRGELFSNDEESIYALSPGQPEEYCRLISELNESGKLPDKIVHLWSLDSYRRESDIESGFKSLPGSLDSRFYSIIFLARAIGKEGIQTPLNLGIVTNNMQSITSDKVIFPEAATTMGPGKIIPQEYKNIVSSSIDLSIPDHQEIDYEILVEQIMIEFLSNLPDQVVAYRGLRRWVQTFEKIRLEGNKASRVERDITEETEGKSLPGQDNSRPDLGTAYKPPENEIERKIVEMWQGLLGIEKIGIYDNFFQLGGHSLLGIRLLSRMRESFQVDIPLKALFDAPTVIDLTRLIEEMFLMEIEGLSEEEISEQVSDIQQEQEKVLDIDTAQNYELPNNMVIRHLNKAETDHFYKDIFEDNVYYKHGIKINKGDIVFDVGANIGLFTLFAHDKCKDATIYSFEPAPPLFEILKTNVSSFGVKNTLFNCGLSNKPGETSFVFYPRTAGMSSFYADKKEEMDVLTAIMKNQQRLGMEGMDQVLEYAGDLLVERFKEKEYVCQLRRLSDIIKEYKIDSISLLKIDVQKSELDVIEGIDGEDWNRIKQVVIEAHDIDGRVDHIRSILSDKGYKVYVEQDELYKGSIIFNIYGIRNDGVR
jgi:FkbM family methyltransferase